MGEVVQIARAGSTPKVRSPIWVAVWSILFAYMQSGLNSVWRSRTVQA